MFLNSKDNFQILKYCKQWVNTAYMGPLRTREILQELEGKKVRVLILYHKEIYEEFNYILIILSLQRKLRVYKKELLQVTICSIQTYVYIPTMDHRTKQYFAVLKLSISTDSLFRYATSTLSIILPFSFPASPTLCVKYQRNWGSGKRYLNL
jgi:hypothetical protein